MVAEPIRARSGAFRGEAARRPNGGPNELRAAAILAVAAFAVASEPMFLLLLATGGSTSCSATCARR
jgi:hypothetical protein